MNNKYTMERKGQFYILREGTRIIYKSKDKSKVRYKYELLEGNRVDRECRAADYGYYMKDAADSVRRMFK